MKVIEKELVQIKISDTWGFGIEVTSQIQELIQSFKPTFSTLLSPSPFLIFFEIGTSSEIVDAFMNELKSIIISEKETLERTTISMLKDEFTLQSDKKGRIAQLPIGSSVSKEKVIWKQG